MSRSGEVECPKTARLRCAPVSSETKAANPHLSKATAAGEVSDVDVEWDRGNEEWWEWYLSLADNPALDGPLTPMPAHDAGELPDDDAVITELAQPYDLAPEAVARYTADSFVRLPGVLSVGTVARLRDTPRRRTGSVGTVPEPGDDVADRPAHARRRSLAEDRRDLRRTA